MSAVLAGRLRPNLRSLSGHSGGKGATPPLHHSHYTAASELDSRVCVCEGGV